MAAVGGKQGAADLQEAVALNAVLHAALDAVVVGAAVEVAVQAVYALNQGVCAWEAACREEGAGDPQCQAVPSEGV